MKATIKKSEGCGIPPSTLNAATCLGSSFFRTGSFPKT